MRIDRISIALLLFFFAASPAHAWGRAEDAGTSAADWLIQAPSARLLARGGAGTADAGGTEAWWTNPAAPATDLGLSAAASVRRHIADTEMGFLSVSVPTAWGVPSIGAMLTRTPGIPRYGFLGESQGTFTVQNWAARCGWALAFGPVSAGVAGTVVQEDFNTERRTGFGGDAGVVWAAAPALRLGVSALRLGQTADGYPLPMEIRLGGGYDVLPGLTAALDVVSPRDAEVYAAAGAEWRPLDVAALRLGWRTGPASVSQLGALAGLSAGAGVAWGGFGLDYAFEPTGALGTAHHVSASYRFMPAKPETEAEPKPATAAEPELPPERPLAVEPRSYEGRMVFTPKTAPKDLKAKSIQFKVKDAEGQIVRSFTFAGQAAPKDWVWDGKDNQGRQVDQDAKYTFAFEYVTDQGVRTETVTWPQVLPVRKLTIAEQGEGVMPEAVFRFAGERERVRSWRLTLLDRETRTPVRVLTGEGALPEQAVWDGKDEKGGWAPPGRRYAYRLELIGADFTQATVEHKVIGVPAEIIAREQGRVRFKLLRILFNFARSTIRAEMADKIEMAGELGGRGAALESIQGHADEIGLRSANRLLSRRRAAAVKAYLIRRGVAVAREAAVEGFGQDRPAAEGETAEARGLNRRVEIVLSAPEARTEQSEQSSNRK